MTDERADQPPMLPRRRVTAPRRSVVGNGTGSDTAPIDTGITDTSAVYLGTLIRAQLRLAIMLVAGFAVTLAVASVAIATIPVLQVATILGVPWSWALHAYGMYPVVVLFALVYVRAASRNEKRYRSLEARR